MKIFFKKTRFFNDIFHPGLISVSLIIIIANWDRAQGGLIANNEWAYIGFLFGLFVTWSGRDRPLCGPISVLGLYPDGPITRVDCNEFKSD